MMRCYLGISSCRTWGRSFIWKRGLSDPIQPALGSGPSPNAIEGRTIYPRNHTPGSNNTYTWYYPVSNYESRYIAYGHTMYRHSREPSALLLSVIPLAAQPLVQEESITA